jgi:hypothetical protein
VYWNGQAANTLIFIDVCNKSITDPTFNVAFDCAPLSQLTPNGTANGSGNKLVEVFRGEEPSGDQLWGCYAAGDTAAAGYTKSTTCYVRVTNNVGSNNDADVEVPFTIVG